jgi:predicted regulator of Ras-like GTPase activity (Roadblock/LC7/MglB family)
MNVKSIALHEKEFGRLKGILSQTQKDLGADLVMLIDRSGQQIATEGPGGDIDQTALASLAAANIAATNGMANLVGEPCFSTLYHQGSRRSIHISEVSKSLALVLVFGQNMAPGMVRWRVRQVAASLDEVLTAFFRRMESNVEPAAESAESSSARLFTDEELDRLFDQMSSKPDIERKA